MAAAGSAERGLLLEIEDATRTYPLKLTCPDGTEMQLTVPKMEPGEIAALP